MVKGKTKLDMTKVVRFIDAPGEVDRADERGYVAREVPYVSKAQIPGQTFTPSLGTFILDIGSNTARDKQVFTSRRRGTNEQEGSPRLEGGKFPCWFHQQHYSIDAFTSARCAFVGRSSAPSCQLIAAVLVFPLRG